MKKLFLIFLLLPFFVQAQNLVPNPSFEDTTGVGCPNGLTQSQLPTGWCAYSSSPDYFNVCSPSANNNSVPQNGWGYQYPYNGNAYCGIWCYQTFQPNTREFYGSQLSSPVTIGQKYYLKLKICLAENFSNCGIDKVGILFSTIPPPNNCLSISPTNDSGFAKNYAPIFSTTIIMDTMNWTVLSGSFIADSLYQYILIGNFFNDTNTDTLIIGPPKFFGYGAYYFIDDVYVGTDSLLSIDNNNLETIISIHPNPFNISAAITIPNNIFIENASFSIYNILGKETMTQDIVNKSFVIERNNLSGGIYFLQVKSNSNTYSQKLIITD